MGAEIVRISHVTFEYIKGIDNMLVDNILHLRSIHRSIWFLKPEGGGRVWTWYLWEIAPHKQKPALLRKKRVWKIAPIHAETPTQVEANDTMIHEIQHVPLISDQEEIRKLQETDPHYTKLIENMKLKNKRSKGDYSLDPHEALYKKIKDHEKEFRALILPKTIQIYVLYKSHNSLGYNGNTRLYLFLKRQYY